MDGSANGRVGAAENVVAFPRGGAEADMSTSGVARHRRHRFPGRTESVRARTTLKRPGVPAVLMWSAPRVGSLG
jgi:hypothetical protein